MNENHVNSTAKMCAKRQFMIMIMGKPIETPISWQVYWKTIICHHQILGESMGKPYF